MTQNRLHIAAVSNNANQVAPIKEKSSRRQEIQACMERMWRENPNQFNPLRDCIQRQRLENTKAAIGAIMPLEDKRVVDLGCGYGEISFFCAENGAKVDAVDIASQALSKVKSKNITAITTHQDCLPQTKLEDDVYDLVVCTEVVGYLQPYEYRLLFAELARLVHPHGVVTCSSSFDLNSDDPLERFAMLAETELEIERWILNYHRLFIKICRFFEAPQTFIQISKDKFLLKNKLQKKNTAFQRFWLKANTSIPLVYAWQAIDIVAKPLARYLRQSPRIRNFLEPICKFLWNEAGISHALFLGRRRPLDYHLPENKVPRELKHKRQVWE